MITETNLGWGLKSLAKGAVKGVAKGTKVAARGVTTGAKYAGKGAVAAAKVPVKVAKTVSKAAFDLATWPIRKVLNGLRSGRANKLAFDQGRVKPTAADHAQARKDTKAMLSQKGVHGKMLAFLAGADDSETMLLGAELGAAGVDDAAIVAASAALAALAKSVATSALKSGWAKSAVSTAATGVQTYQAGQQAYQAGKQVYSTGAQAAQAVQNVSTEDVQNEVEAQQEEVVDQALAGAGFLSGAEDIVLAASRPAAMSAGTARRVRSAARKVLCQASRGDLVAAGGPAGPAIATSYCQAVAAGNKARIRALGPTATKLASRLAAVAHTNARFAVRTQRQLPPRPMALLGLSAEEVTLLGALDDAPFEEVAVGLSGTSMFDTKKLFAFAPAALAVGVGVYLLTKKDL